MEPADVTTLLHAWVLCGDRAAFQRIWPLIYDELLRRAARVLRRERAGHTFAPSDLIHETFLKIARGMNVALKDRAHFFAIAASCMREILVDHARKRDSKRRGGGIRPITFDEVRIPVERPWELVALDEALKKLAEFDERRAQVVELHYFGGLTQEEIGIALDVHVNTVARDLRVGEAWLRSRVGGAVAQSGGKRLTSGSTAGR